MGDFEIMKYLHKIYFLWDGCHIYVIYVHSSPYLFVCGDDRITCYPEVDDLIGEPGDA